MKYRSLGSGAGGAVLGGSSLDLSDLASTLRNYGVC